MTSYLKRSTWGKSSTNNSPEMLNLETPNYFFAKKLCTGFLQHRAVITTYILSAPAKKDGNPEAAWTY